MHLLALLVALASPPQVAAVDVEGPSSPHRDRMRGLVADLADAPLSLTRLVAAIRRLETVPDLGGVQVLGLPPPGAPAVPEVRLVFRYDARPRRLSAVHFVEGGGPVDPEASRALHDRFQVGARLHLAAGEPFHPFLADLDRESIRGFYLDRGHRDVDVRSEEAESDGLVSLLVRVTPGARYVAREVTLVGAVFPPEVEAGLRTGLTTRPGEAVSASDVARDRDHLRERQCRRGFPRARVEARETAGPASDAPDRPLDVLFEVAPGPQVLTGRVQVVGRWVPWRLVADLPLREGDPYCPSVLDEARAQVDAHLRDHGFPDPRVSIHTRERLTRDGTRRIAVTFDIESRGDVRIERIWFSGNRVTREDILRQMLAVREGEVYRQSTVDASVQAMRRSDLFRRVGARVLAGTRPDHVYLYFQIDERDPLSVDVLKQRLTLRNADLARWPADYAQFEAGRAFRGGGQRLDIYAHPDRHGLEWFHPFLSRYWLAELSMLRQVTDTSAYDEAWVTGRLGIGLQALEGSFAIVPFGEVEWTRSDHEVESGLPVLDGDAFTVASGGEVRLDLNRRDDERIPYLGFDANARVRAGRSFFGERFDWGDYEARVRGHLPLWTTQRGQHFVLRLEASMTQVFADVEQRLQAHQRVLPQARGYGSRATGLDFELPEETLRLGALHAAEGTAEVRIPLPFGRRNAVSPFYDVAVASDEPSTLLDRRFESVGLNVSFSFFDEKLEGQVWGAWPFVDEDPVYVGISLGGNF